MILLTLEKSRESELLVFFNWPITFPMSLIELAPSDLMVSSHIFLVSSSFNCFGKKLLIISISLVSAAKSSLRPAFSLEEA
mgnify:CR=1 FL=1